MDPAQLRAMIASAQKGSAEAYQAMLDAYGPRLYGYFLRACGNHHDAEDLLGEFMLRMVRRLKDYDDRGRLEPWLFRIAANMVRDRIRRGKANPTPLSISAEVEGAVSLGERLVADGPLADAEMLAREASVELNQALDKLDSKTRDMMLLRHFAEMSFKEIAEMYDCPLGTVLARVHRGLRTLKEVMGKRHGTD
ncbi:MAG: sigma-70 family RNA polymerase sigma factor [Phycisphaerae bacterium]|jgi:RNA polymerase sigma-70 factor (ECF subfamily)